MVFARTVLAGAVLLCAALNSAHAADNVPKLSYPTEYRNWIFLTSGLDMTYVGEVAPDHHMFDNVFVNPEAYNAFKATGRWPDKTILVKEARGAQSKGSINQSGMFQQGGVMALEVHAKDDKRFGGWAFFAFDGTKPATMIPKDAVCYTCHAAHGAVDTTFVQFYPTLLPIAEAKKTLSPNYLKEASGAQK